MSQDNDPTNEDESSREQDPFAQGFAFNQVNNPNREQDPFVFNQVNNPNRGQDPFAQGFVFNQVNNPNRGQDPFAQGFSFDEKMNTFAFQFAPEMMADQSLQTAPELSAEPSDFKTHVDPTVYADPDIEVMRPNSTSSLCAMCKSLNTFLQLTSKADGIGPCHAECFAKHMPDLFLLLMMRVQPDELQLSWEEAACLHAACKAVVSSILDFNDHLTYVTHIPAWKEGLRKTAELMQSLSRRFLFKPKGPGAEFQQPAALKLGRARFFPIALPSLIRPRQTLLPHFESVFMLEQVTHPDHPFYDGIGHRLTVVVQKPKDITAAGDEKADSLLVPLPVPEPDVCVVPDKPAPAMTHVDRSAFNEPSAHVPELTQPSEQVDMRRVQELIVEVSEKKDLLDSLLQSAGVPPREQEADYNNFFEELLLFLDYCVFYQWQPVARRIPDVPRAVTADQLEDPDQPWSQLRDLQKFPAAVHGVPASMVEAPLPPDTQPRPLFFCANDVLCVREFRKAGVAPQPPASLTSAPRPDKLPCLAPALTSFFDVDIELHLPEGVPKRVLSGYSHYGLTAAHHACLKNNVSMLRALHRAGVDLFQGSLQQVVVYMLPSQMYKLWVASSPHEQPAHLAFLAHKRLSRQQSSSLGFATPYGYSSARPYKGLGREPQPSLSHLAERTLATWSTPLHFSAAVGSVACFEYLLQIAPQEALRERNTALKTAFDVLHPLCRGLAQVSDVFSIMFDHAPYVRAVAEQLCGLPCRARMHVLQFLFTKDPFQSEQNSPELIPDGPSVPSPGPSEPSSTKWYLSKDVAAMYKQSEDTFFAGKHTRAFWKEPFLWQQSNLDVCRSLLEAKVDPTRLVNDDDANKDISRRVTWLMGIDETYGVGSSIRTVLVSDPLYDRNILREIFSFQRLTSDGLVHAIVTNTESTDVLEQIVSLHPRCVEQYDHRCETPLFCVARLRHRPTLKKACILLRAGANPHAVSAGKPSSQFRRSMSLLYVAAMHCTYELMVPVLAFTNGLRPPSHLSNTLPEPSLWFGDPKEHLFLDSNARHATPIDVNEGDSDGNTPLMCLCGLTCVTSPQLEGCVELLLRYEADPNRLNMRGQSALLFAVENGHVDVTKRLLSAKADVTIQDNNQQGLSDALSNCHRNHHQMEQLLGITRSDMQDHAHLAEPKYRITRITESFYGEYRRRVSVMSISAQKDALSHEEYRWRKVRLDAALEDVTAEEEQKKEMGEGLETTSSG